MNPEQRYRLVELLPQMAENARRYPTHNAYRQAMKRHDDLKAFLNCDPSKTTAEQWLQIAERDAAAHIQEEAT